MTDMGPNIQFPIGPGDPNSSHQVCTESVFAHLGGFPAPTVWFINIIYAPDPYGHIQIHPISQFRTRRLESGEAG